MGSISWVTPNIAVSGRQPLSAAPQMQQEGITAVLNLTIRHDPNWSFQTFEDPTPDDGMHKTSAWFGKGIGQALSIVRHGGKILVHCESGIHRGPSMVYAILRAMGRSPVEATHLVLRARPNAMLRYAADAEQALHELGLVHDN